MQNKKSKKTKKIRGKILMKQIKLRTVGALKRERERELYFNKQKTKHEKCFIYNT